MKSIIASIFASVLLAATPSCFAGSPPPPSATPFPGPAQTTDWLIVTGIDRFANGVITFCDKRKGGFVGVGQCIAKGSLTPTQTLAKLGPKGAELVGVSPYLSSLGKVEGIVLYYVRASPEDDSVKP